MIRRLLVASVWGVCVSGFALGQVVPAPAAQPAATTQADALENPVTFLLIRLASTEESLNAVNTALGQTGSQVKATKMQASNATNANQAMDRNGGGPVPWDQFYGKTAKSFYVSDFFTSHPIDRPAQFDYIYRANQADAQKAQREVADLKGQIDQLQARQAQLEADRGALWARIAAAMVAQRDISDQPIYEYHLTCVSMDKSLPGEPSERADAVEALAQFLRTMDSVMANVDGSVTGHQRQAIESLKINSEQAQKDLSHALAAINQPEINKQLKPLTTLARSLAVIAASSAEAADLAADAQRSGDVIEKSTSLGLLQTAWADITEKLGALDDGITKVAGDWHVVADMHKALPAVSVIPAPPMVDAIIPGAAATDLAAEAKNSGQPVDLLAAVQLPRDVDRGSWQRTGSEIECNASEEMSLLRLPYSPDGEYDFKISFTRISDNKWIEMVLRDGGRKFSWEMGAINNTVAGFAQVDNHAIDHNRSTTRSQLTNGQTYTAEVKVRRRSVTAFLDGQRVTMLRLDKVRLSPAPVSTSGDSLGLGVGVGSQVVFHAIEVTPVADNAAIGKL